MRSRRLLVFIAAGWGLAALAVLAVASGRFRGWLEGTAPLAEWLVAGGTAALALATYTLAKRAGEEAAAVRDEARIVTEQVELQREQLESAIRPVVVPSTPLDWVLGTGVYAGMEKTKSSVLLVNCGNGPALNTHGVLYWEHRGSGISAGRKFYAGSIAAGETLGARMSVPYVAGLAHAVGYVRFLDLAGDEWATEFRYGLGDGNQLYCDSQPPERLTDPLALEGRYPPQDWNAPTTAFD